MTKKDYCAYRKDGPEEYKLGSETKKVLKIIAPTEEGWPSPLKARPFDELTRCEVWITSENAKSAKAEVIFEKDRIKIEPL